MSAAAPCSAGAASLAALTFHLVNVCECEYEQRQPVVRSGPHQFEFQVALSQSQGCASSTRTNSAACAHLSCGRTTNSSMNGVSLFGFKRSRSTPAHHASAKNLTEPSGADTQNLLTKHEKPRRSCRAAVKAQTGRSCQVRSGYLGVDKTSLRYEFGSTSNTGSEVWRDKFNYTRETKSSTAPRLPSLPLPAIP